MLKQWLERLSLRAFRHRLDKRSLQEELDLHRLYLITTYFDKGGGLDPDGADALDTKARELGLEGTRAAVAEHLGRQVLDICRALHATLDAAGDDAHSVRQLAAAAELAQQQPHPQASPPPLRGLGASMGAAQILPAAAPPASLEQPDHPSAGGDPRRRRLSRAQVAAAFLRARGFALGVAPSSVQHAESGDGLWVRGEAAVGQVVALYPGVTYPPLHHRQIPGYPLVARANPYLLARFDGTVLDAKPWGRGAAGGEAAPAWPEEPQNDAEKALAQLEGRHPLAFAHLANHPPAGSLPNVVVAAFDPPAELAGGSTLRAYLPTLGVGHPPAAPAPGLALVALRALRDEEVFLNYRLNPSTPHGLPAWYAPVDAEEDARRWA